MRYQDPLSVKSFNLGVRMVKLARYLHEYKDEDILTKHLVRCGTNPGATVRESGSAAESHLDKTNQLAKAQNEITELIYWVDILLATGYIAEAEHASICLDAEEVYNLLTSSKST